MSNLYLTSSFAAQDSPRRELKPGRWYLAVFEACWRRHSDWQEQEQLLRKLGTSHLGGGRGILGKSCGLLEEDSTTERKQHLENIYQSNGTTTPIFAAAGLRKVAMLVPGTGQCFRSRRRKITRFTLTFRRTCLSREQGAFLTIFDSHCFSILKMTRCPDIKKDECLVYVCCCNGSNYFKAVGSQVGT